MIIVKHNEIKYKCKELVNRIEKDCKNYDLIVCITNWWLIPTYYIAKHLKINSVECLNINSYKDTIQWEIIDNTVFKKDFSDKRVLLVDDLVDSWETIQYILDNYKFKEIDIAVLFHKNWSKIEPNYCHTYNIRKEEWIEFSYES